MHKTVLHSFIFFLFLFNISGCTLIRMAQETGESIKTASTHGYQNGVKPDEIRNIKDYIVDENEFVILAEGPHKTLYKLRETSVSSKFDMLNDLADYCEDIKGEVQFGKQFGASLAREFDSIDFEFSNIKEEYRQKRLKGYRGWMRCVKSEDDFEIKRKGRSFYFTIYHAKEQPGGYSMRWYIDYFDLEEMDINKLNIGVWSYSSLTQIAGLCYLKGGVSTISNRYTENQEMSMDTYLLQRLDPLNGQKPYLLASGKIRCIQSEASKTDHLFDIRYSNKYQKLLYTKRQ